MLHKQNFKWVLQHLRPGFSQSFCPHMTLPYSRTTFSPAQSTSNTHQFRLMTKKKAPSLPYNETIKVSKVTLIDEKGKLMGVQTIKDALAIAASKKLDLVQVEFKTYPPVCKLYDYHQAQYEQNRLLKNRKKNSTQADTKEIRFGCNIAEGDVVTKVNAMRRYFERGDNVLVVITFMRKGEIMDLELSKAIIRNIYERLADCCVVDEAEMPRVSPLFISKLFQSKKKASQPNQQEKSTAPKEPTPANPAPEEIPPVETSNAKSIPTIEHIRQSTPKKLIVFRKDEDGRDVWEELSDLPIKPQAFGNGTNDKQKYKEEHNQEDYEERNQEDSEEHNQEPYEGDEDKVIVKEKEKKDKNKISKAKQHRQENKRK